MKNIMIFTLYPTEGASSNYRILMYCDDLKKYHNIKTQNFWSQRYCKLYINNKRKYFGRIVLEYIKGMIKRVITTILLASKMDIIIIQKGYIPYLPINFIRYFKRKGCKVVFDIDDAVYIRTGDFSDGIALKCDYVVCGNKNLHNHYCRINKRCHIIPTVDKTSDYRMYRKDTYENKIVGWIGSNSTIENLNLVVEPLNRIIERHPEVQFNYISAEPLGYNKKIKNSKFVKWSKEDCIENLSNFTIGIMPLYDTNFNRGKCGFKLIQYMNLYKPFITSPIGVNLEIASREEQLAFSEKDWEDKMEELLFNESLYRECQEDMEDKMKTKYSYNIVLSEWLDILDKL